MQPYSAKSMSSPIRMTPSVARRLAVASQLLDRRGTLTPETSAHKGKQQLREMLTTLRCLQLDPIRAVERTQYLVPWSRLGPYDREWLDDLHQERVLFEYWAHAASLVLTEDYPLHEYEMRRYGRQSKRLHQWVKANQPFKAYILNELRARGPLLTGDFEDRTTAPWESGGWSSGRSVPYMLDYLWTSGEILVARREGLKRWWDLAERVLPADRPAGGWPAEAVTADAAQKALRALGIGRAVDIKQHFTEKRYPHLDSILEKLIREGQILPVEIIESDWGDGWFMHADALSSWQKIEQGDFQGRTTLLSPFDNLIRNRDRTELMWDFFYRIEIYVPKAKRQYGYYVLPILHEERLIGRIDPKMDHKNGVLSVNAVYAEPYAADSRELGPAVAAAIADLATFLGASHIEIGSQLPAAWRQALTGL